MRTTVVHCRNAKYDVYIGRPSKWGNPFRLEDGQDRVAVIHQYREWLLKQPELLAAIPSLRGRILGCWCKPQPCHGDVLAELANAARSKRRSKSKD